MGTRKDKLCSEHLKVVGPTFIEDTCSWSQLLPPFHFVFPSFPFRMSCNRFHFQNPCTQLYDIVHVPNFSCCLAELPLYLILGMLCGVVSVAFTRLVAWFTKFFDFIKEKYDLPAVVCPALGGLGAGIIALKYPGILYWGFTNVEEILHTGKTASAPGIWLLTQLSAAKVVATALCKGSGLVGGLYAPSLMIGAAVGAVFGGSAAELINRAIPGNAAVAQPQAYALVNCSYSSLCPFFFF